MKIRVSEHAGACYGVKRALALADMVLEQGKPVHTLGPLIHNPQVVADLKARGAQVVTCVDEVDEGILLIRSHGVAPAVIEEAQARGLEIANATCSYVLRVQEAVRLLRAHGYRVLIVGEAGHPEVEALRAYAGEDALVVQSPEDVPLDIAPSVRIGVVAQTTQQPETVGAIIEMLKARGIEYDVRNTICSATRQRQRSSAQLAREADCMIVIGGRNSGNTARLYKICVDLCPNTHHIESVAELDPAWFEEASEKTKRSQTSCPSGTPRTSPPLPSDFLVGVTAGASTPQEQIDRVVAALEALS